jgi:integrase
MGRRAKPLPMATFKERNALAPRPSKPYTGRSLGSGGAYLCCRWFGNGKPCTWVISYPGVRPHSTAWHPLDAHGDDYGATADGVSCLTETQAFDRASDWWRLRKGTGGHGVVDPRITFGDILNAYLTERRGEGFELNTYPGIYRRWQDGDGEKIAALGAIRYVNLTEQHIRDQHQAVRDTPPKAPTHTPGVKPKVRAGYDSHDQDRQRKRRQTANRELGSVLAALNWAWEKKIITGEKWWTRIKTFRGAAAPLGQILKDHEVDAFMRACERLAMPELALIVQVGLLCGLRRNELLGLQMGDYQEADGMLKVQRSRRNVGQGTKDTKTPAGKRTVPLMPEGIKIMGQVMAIGAGRALKDAMLYSHLGKPWTSSLLYDALGRAFKEAKLDCHRINAHDFRRTFATYWARHGLPDRMLQTMLGHADGETLRHYCDVDGFAVQRAMQAINPQVGFQIPELTNMRKLNDGRRRRPAPVRLIRANKDSA